MIKKNGGGGAYLLTVNEDVLASSQLIINPPDSSFEMGFQVGGCAVHDVETIALEMDTLFRVCIDRREPGGVKDLYEGGNVVGGEEDGVEDGGEGAEEECAGWKAGGVV